MKPIAPAKGIAFAFPDICNTPAGPSIVCTAAGLFVLTTGIRLLRPRG